MVKDTELGFHLAHGTGGLTGCARVHVCVCMRVRLCARAHVCVSVCARESPAFIREGEARSQPPRFLCGCHRPPRRAHGSCRTSLAEVGSPNRLMPLWIYTHQREGVCDMLV